MSEFSASMTTDAADSASGGGVAAAHQKKPQSAPSVVSNYWGGWLESAKEFAGRAQEMAEIAGKVAQEKAFELAKQAEEASKNYDFEKATSILMGTVGGPIDTREQTPPRHQKKKSLKEALEELDMCYVTENVVSMAFPYDFDMPKNRNKTGNDIDIVAALMRKRHAGRFMIWNVSEESYNYSKFGDQVLEYKFPGHPAPPLGLLFKICTSVESWLDADERNVAVVHCLTGKGRTAALMACVLAWIGEFTSPMEALQYVSDRRGISVDYLTIPSQRRYVQYFSNMLDGVKPRSEPLLLRRVILNGVPIFGRETDKEDGYEGCCPYLQLFKNGRLIATAAPQPESTGGSMTTHDETLPVAYHSLPGGRKPQSESQMQLRWIKASEGSASFTLDCPIQGDILLRCRHASRSGVRVSMFRSGFHTGYVPSGVLRLTKAQLDGASSDPRYDEDFFIDLIFAPVLTASGVSADSINTSSSVPSSTSAGDAVTDSGLVIDESSTDKYEQNLHRDAKFWESISSRKQRAKRRKARKFLSNQQERFSIIDDMKSAGDDPDGPFAHLNFLSDVAAAADGATGSADGLSDMDLIMQLAQAEGDDNSSSNGQMSSGVLTGGTVSEHGNDSDDFAMVGAGNTAAGSQQSTASGSYASSPSVASTNKTSADSESANSSGSVVKGTPNKNELQALEDLEKELGLDLFGGGSAGGGATATDSNAKQSTEKTSSSSAPIDDDGDLDELEKYLQSFSSGK